MPHGPACRCRRFRGITTVPAATDSSTNSGATFSRRATARISAVRFPFLASTICLTGLFIAPPPAAPSRSPR